MNVFDLFAKITLDSSEYEEQLSEAGSKTGGFADKLKSGLATAGKVAAAGVAVATTAVVALGKSAIDGFADYEQLVGGVETLFGSGGKNIEEYAASVGKTVEEVRGEFNQLMIAEQTVMENANNAFSSAGLSANEYMETVTSFSASLIQSLGGDTEAAASYANQAIIDMADNANKMGSSMESIQNAYQGFAKQNYTMLDNLKLGYGGTKEEMERLLQDADALSDSFNLQVDASGNLVYSYADIVDAIHIVQTEMGITGTTAAEASSTIQGSVDSAKAAWMNLLTGLGDANADMEQLIVDFVESASTAAGNLIPAIGRVLTGIFETLEDHGPDMLAEGVILLGKLALGLIQAIPDMVRKIPEITRSIVEAFTSRSSEFTGIGKNIVKGVWEGISALASWFADNIRNFFGGIVDGVKDTLGIHSPSRVFASIGGYMAEGLGEGWDGEYSIIKKRIEDGMEFETAKVDFAASGLGISSAGIINGIVTPQTQGGAMTVNLVMPDGDAFARYYLPSFMDVANSNGTPIVNPA